MAKIFSGFRGFVLGAFLLMLVGTAGYFGGGLLTSSFGAQGGGTVAVASAATDAATDRLAKSIDAATGTANGIQGELSGAVGYLESRAGGQSVGIPDPQSGSGGAIVGAGGRIGISGNPPLNPLHATLAICAAVLLAALLLLFVVMALFYHFKPKPGGVTPEPKANAVTTAKKEARMNLSQKFYAAVDLELLNLKGEVVGTIKAGEEIIEKDLAFAEGEAVKLYGDLVKSVPVKPVLRAAVPISEAFPLPVPAAVVLA